MTPIYVVSVIAAYFVVLLLISRIASRHADNNTFFTGGRKAPWPLVAFAMIGAAISGVTFISVPGMVVTKGYAYLQMVLGFIVGYVVIAFVLVPLFYRRNLVSIYSWLDERFGRRSYRSGAWMFFISKILGASVRFFVVCAVLQLLVCDPLGIPFELNVLLTIALIWLYTAEGGVKTLIWTDVLKSACLILSVVLCIYYISTDLGIRVAELPGVIGGHDSARMLFFSDPKSGLYFWKQFVAGIFMAIAMNGLDQDMMQRHLACKDSKASGKNMIISGVAQFFVIAMFLMLGTLLMVYSSRHGIDIPEKTDEFFGLVATHPTMPVVVGTLFVLGLISSAYSAAGSALTSLTTSFTVDILDAQRRYISDSRKLGRIRKTVHVGMSALMAGIIIAFYHASSSDAISAVYTLASYTYGPILGMFVFGLFTTRQTADRFVPWICVLAPVAAWCLQKLLMLGFGYETGFELLLINALFTMIGLAVTSKIKANQSTQSGYVEESV